MSGLACPRCDRANRGEARFCAHCGLPLFDEHGGPVRGGRLRHPYPEPPPAGFEPCADAVELYWRSESSFGGQRLIGTEGIGVKLFNGGYPLKEATFLIRGQDRNGREVFAGEFDARVLPRGREVTIEVPSYELPDSIRSVRVSLKSAAFAVEDGAIGGS